MDPIAVDLPAKPLSPSPMALASRPMPAPASRAEPKPEPSKPPFASAPAASATPTAPSLAGKLLLMVGLQPTKRNGMVVMAAVCSLLAGYAAVKMIGSGSKPEATQPLSTAADHSKPKEEEKAPSPQTDAAKPASNHRISDVPDTTTSNGITLPTLPTTSGSGATSTAAGEFVPVPPVIPKPYTGYTNPSTTSTPYTPAPPVIPATLPSTPASLPMIPSTSPDGFKPGLPPPTVEVTPGSSKSSNGVTLPQPESMIPPSSPVFRASADEPKTTPMTPATLPMVPSTSPTVPSASPMPPIVPTSPSLPELPVIPSMTPSTPSAPSSPTTSPSSVPSSPSVPSMTPPSVILPSTSSTPSKPLTIEYSKPAGTAEVKPSTTSDRAATTSFDVDVHEPKQGDTYGTISRDYYNDGKYAQALQAYNKNRPIQGGAYLEVPPIHILKKYYPQLIVGTAPAVTTAGAKTGDGWGPAGDASPAFRPNIQRTFTVPTGGMTMGEIARDTLGSQYRWRDIYDLNPALSPGDRLPSGTLVKIPTETK